MDYHHPCMEQSWLRTVSSFCHAAALTETNPMETALQTFLQIVRMSVTVAQHFHSYLSSVVLRDWLLLPSVSDIRPNHVNAASVDNGVSDSLLWTISL
jgi:hypothetical protein